MVAEVPTTRAALTKYGQDNKMNKTIHNITTGEVLISTMTQDEINEINTQAEILKAETAKVVEAQAERQAKRSTALAKLEALGLDEADLKALGL